MRTNGGRLVLSWLVLLCLLVETPFAFAQGTAFTYQGVLKDGAANASGNYDFSFRLATDPLGANWVGNPFATNSIAVSNGFFCVLVDFGAGIFTGQTYWLQVGVRTNGGSSFNMLAPLQQITPTPYAITAGTITGSLPAAQISGPIAAGLLSGSNGSPLVFNNSSNSFAGAFFGNGNGLTNLSGTNVINPYEINVANYGAIPTANGSIDCTLAFSNAVDAALQTGWPIRIPGTPGNFYYKVSGPIIIDYFKWVRGGGATESPLTIRGDNYAHIKTTVDAPILILTNSFNTFRISGLWLTGIGYNPANNSYSGASTSPGFYLSGIGTSGDDGDIESCIVEGFRHGLYAESYAQYSIKNCALQANYDPFFLTHTNPVTGNGQTGNNSILFESCFLGANWNGGWIDGGGVVTFENTEGGGQPQTNFVSIGASSATAVTLRGGNCELAHGAGVVLVGPANRVTMQNWGLLDFSSDNSVVTVRDISGTAYGSYINITGGTMPPCDFGGSQSPLISSWPRPVQCFGSNKFSGAWTCRFGSAAQNDLVFLGNESSPIEGFLWQHLNYDAKGRTYLWYGAKAYGLNGPVFNYNLLQYNYDLADGRIPQTSLPNTWLGNNIFSTLNVTGSLGNSATQAIPTLFVTNLVFNASSTAPIVTNKPAAWIKVQIGGTAYKIPAYQ